MENLSSEIEASLDGAGAATGSPYGLGTPALERIGRVLDGVFTALAHSFPSPATLPELQFELTIGASLIHLAIVVPGGREALCDRIQSGSVMALTQSSGEYDRLLAQYEQWGGSGEEGQLTWGDVGQLAKAKFSREIGLFRREASAWAQSHADGFLESLEAMLPGTEGDGSGGFGGGGWGPGNDSGGGYSGSGGNEGEWFQEMRFRLRGLKPQLSCSIFAAEDGSAGLEGTLRTDWGLSEYHAELSGFYETRHSRWDLTVTATDSAQGIALGVRLL